MAEGLPTSPSTALSSSTPAPVHFPLHGGSHCDVLLFADVTNTAELLTLFHRQQLRAALLNPALLPDPFPLLVALTKTTASSRRRAFKAKDVYNEVAFNLAPTTHIQTAVERFLPAATDTRVLLVCIDATAEHVAAVQQRVHGRLTALSTLSDEADYASLQKLYKITDAELQLPPSTPRASAYSAAMTARIATK